MNGKVKGGFTVELNGIRAFLPGSLVGAQLFEESLKEIETRPGSIVRGVVVSIDKDVVLVDAGLKSESAIPAEQFKNAAGELEIQVGDEVDVECRLSR
ncbi:hypothetical protein CRX72_13355 [Pantoea sp. BRM17]|nr:hypothetical protein CRX72_13355 [Pantoea sp. BRM17]